MVLSLLLACGDITAGDPPEQPAPADTAGDDSGDDTGDEYIADEDPVAPSLTLDEVALAVSEGLTATHAMQPSLWFDAYDAAMAGRDAGCPYTNEDYQVYYGYDYWYDDCTSQGGTSFYGYGLGYHYVDYAASSTTFYRHLGYWNGDARITRPDGTDLVSSGYAYLYDYDSLYYGSSGQYFEMYGEFRSDAPMHADTWLADGVSVSLLLSRYWYGTDNGSLQLRGGLSHLEGVVNAVVFDDLFMLSEAHGSQCAIEPGGAVSVRETSGEWYDVVFHGPSAGSTLAFPAECDGCGEVWFRGALLGEVCPDLSTLTAWGS